MWAKSQPGASWTLFTSPLRTYSPPDLYAPPTSPWRPHRTSQPSPLALRLSPSTSPQYSLGTTNRYFAAFFFGDSMTTVESRSVPHFFLTVLKFKSTSKITRPPLRGPVNTPAALKVSGCFSMYSAVSSGDQSSWCVLPSGDFPQAVPPFGSSTPWAYIGHVAQDAGSVRTKPLSFVIC